MKAFADEQAYGEVRAQFVQQVKPLIAAGAEIIIPAGGLAMMLRPVPRPLTVTTQNRWLFTGERR